MNSSTPRPRKSRRFVAVFVTLAVFAGLVTITQVSLANIRRGGNGGGQANCPPSATAPAPPSASGGHDHGDGATAAPSDPAATAEPTAAAEETDAAAADAQRSTQRQRPRGRCQPTSGPSAPGGGTSAPPLEVLGTSCEQSQLQPHDGFQNGNRCVSTEFGEVGVAEQNPTLLISQAPNRVRANRPFTIQVSTRNIVRDRFLAAAAGGYYKESAYLTPEGLVRGHFHTACRMLTGRNAPDPAPVPVFFAATEDGKGGARPDVVTVQIPGLPSTGTAQCAAWAGDGSHRIPMMQRANQIPAFDAVRITVTR